MRSRKSMRTSPTLPEAVRQCGFALRRAPVWLDLGEHERPVADQRLGPAPGRSHLVGAMARPGVGPVRGEHVREVVARFVQVDFERPVVERLGRGDVVEQERRDVPLLAQLAPGVDEIAGRQRVPVAPAGVLAQHEEVGQAVGRDVHVLRQLRHDVEVVVDAQEAAEELLDHDRRLARVGVAGRVGIGPDERELDLGGRRRALRALLGGAVEGRVVGLAGARVVERQVAHERDLEERVALAARDRSAAAGTCARGGNARSPRGRRRRRAPRRPRAASSAPRARARRPRRSGGRAARRRRRRRRRRASRRPRRCGGAGCAGPGSSRLP